MPIVMQWERIKIEMLGTNLIFFHIEKENNFMSYHFIQKENFARMRLTTFFIHIEKENFIKALINFYTF